MSNVFQIRKSRLCSACFAAMETDAPPVMPPLTAANAAEWCKHNICASCRGIVRDAMSVILAKQEGGA